MRRLCSFIVLLASLASAPAHAQFYRPNYGGADDESNWVAPDGAFAVRVPNGWNVFIDPKDPNTVEFRPIENIGDATLFIRRLKVPAGAHPRQVMLNGVEQRLRKLPSFKETSRREAKINGRLAAAVAGMYYFQGNNQFPRGVEEVYFVDNDAAFVIHFEVFAAMAADFAPLLDKFYKSFIARPPKNLGNAAPGRPPQAGGGPINPDTVQY